MKKNNTHALVLSGMLSVIAFFLSFIEFAVPFLPPFLKFDFTFIPIFFALLTLGYKNAMLVAFLKDLLHFLFLSHEPTGAIANLLVEFIFLTTFMFFYKKNNKNIIFGGVLATIFITIFMSLVNYFVLLPLYGYIMNLGDIVKNVKTIISIGIIPFNILKGVLLIILFFLTKNILKSIPKNLLKNFN